MSNSAMISTRKNYDNHGIGIYLYTHGSREEVEAFLAYCKMKGYRDLEFDNSYGMARLVQVIANYIGGALSIGIAPCDNLGGYDADNGVYLVDCWDIFEHFGRFVTDHQDEPTPPANMIDLLVKIDQSQPEFEQLGEDTIRLRASGNSFSF